MKVEVKAVESKINAANQEKTFVFQLTKANIMLRNQTECNVVKKATDGITRS